MLLQHISNLIRKSENETYFVLTSLAREVSLAKFQ